MNSCVKKRVFKEQPLVFHNIPSYVFPIIMVVGSILTISISYITSYSLGHTPSFPYTDITHTGRYIPERYFFRVGMIVMGVDYLWIYFLLFSFLLNKRRQMQNIKFTNNLFKIIIEYLIIFSIFLFGILASIAIIISSCCITSNDDMPWVLHSICATSFFIFSLFAQLLNTLISVVYFRRLYYLKKNNEEEKVKVIFINKFSLILKILISLICCILLILFIIVKFVKINFPLGNIIEWTATLLILIYNITYAIDWKMANNYTTVTEYEEIEYEECQ